MCITYLSLPRNHLETYTSRNLKSCEYDPFVPELRNVKESKGKYVGGRGSRNMPREKRELWGSRNMQMWKGEIQKRKKREIRRRREGEKCANVEMRNTKERNGKYEGGGRGRKKYANVEMRSVQIWGF